MAALKLQLITPSKVAAEVEASAVTLPGALGEFTILPGHAPYVAEIRPGIVNFASAKGKESLVISSGFAEVINDELLVLCRSVSRREDLDVNVIRTDLEEASAEIAGVSVDQPEYAALKERVDTLSAQLAFVGN